MKPRRRSWRKRAALALAALVGVGVIVFFLARWLVFPTERPAPAPWVQAQAQTYCDQPMAFSADSAWFYYATPGQLVSLDLRTGAEQRAPLTDRDSDLALTVGQKLFRVAESTNDNILLQKPYLSVATVNGGTIGEWKQVDPERDERNYPRVLSASPAGETVALVSDHNERGASGITHGGQKLEIFSARNPSERRLLMKQLSIAPYPPKFSANGSVLVWHDAGYSLSVWRASDGHRLLNLPNTASHGYALSADGSRVASQQRGRCCVWSVASGEELYNWSAPVMQGMEFHPDGTLVTTGSLKKFGSLMALRGILHIHNPATGRAKVFRVYDDGPVRSVMISPDGRFLAVCGGTFGEQSVKLWRWEQFAP
jgi:WD40 repeat protein